MFSFFLKKGFTECLRVETNLPSSLQSRLKDSWAEIFRSEVLAILLESEEDFATLYGITGRPNFSVARILGLCFLQELNGFSDRDPRFCQPTGRSPF